MRRSARIVIFAIAALVTAAPTSQAAYFVKPSADRFLDFLTHVVYDATGDPQGAGSQVVYSNLDIWTKNEPMATSAASFTVSPTVEPNPTPWYSITLDPIGVEGPGPARVDPGVEGAGSNGVCLHDYCLSGEAFIWGDPNLLARPVMEITWTECTAGCVDVTSGAIQGQLYGNHLVWTAGFDPAEHKGTVSNLCMYVNEVPVSFRCGLADYFGYGTVVNVGCYVYRLSPTCGSMVYVND